ncbi:hypothetical protein LEP1GSC058_4144 [Leptospira fainei serovar Hurstbridge str. BUT 6]|uniref:Uncharacterized protein n=1 Tax=Leptospira fainei serovar Hurstbridge str. BUT 6 TaxID=1193011 RepID=S3UUM4_9LEPT|nr:hypothetical protein [Leptospira fainei]EPG72948.1 hypothetical protein LEP1GSC058_4144 [Leptospira fainei serovar Hurstbridge str. BUT 6]
MKSKIISLAEYKLLRGLSSYPVENKKYKMQILNFNEYKRFCRGFIEMSTDIE